MKTQKNKVKWMLILVLSGIFTIGLFAQQGQGRQMEPRERPPHPHYQQMPPAHIPDSAHKMHRNGPMMDIPGLTDYQMTKIKKAHLEHMKAVTPLRCTIREQKAHLETLLATQPVEMKAVDQVADEMAKNKAALLKIAIRLDQEIRGFLTPEQQIIFDTKPKPFLGKEKEKNHRLKGK